MTEDGIKDHLRDLHLGTEKQLSELKLPVGATYVLSGHTETPFPQDNKTNSKCSLEERVRANVKVIKNSSLIRDELKAHTKGLIFDIKTGKLTEVQ